MYTLVSCVLLVLAGVFLTAAVVVFYAIHAAKVFDEVERDRENHGW